MTNTNGICYLPNTQYFKILYIYEYEYVYIYQHFHIYFNVLDLPTGIGN